MIRSGECLMKVDFGNLLAADLTDFYDPYDYLFGKTTDQKSEVRIISQICSKKISLVFATTTPHHSQSNQSYFLAPL